eukprot:3154046-Rhodomonas_salina.2
MHTTVTQPRQLRDHSTSTLISLRPPSSLVGLASYYQPELSAAGLYQLQVGMVNLVSRPFHHASVLMLACVDLYQLGMVKLWTVTYVPRMPSYSG